MKRLMDKGIWLGILGIALLLTACGGGGGGGGGFTPPAINSTPLAITTANQNSVAATATDGISGTANSGTYVLGAVTNKGTSFNVFDFTSTKLLGYVNQGDYTNSNVATGASASQTVNCDSGTITLSANVADPNSGILVAGDSVRLSANSCHSNVDGTTINGSVTLTIKSGSIDTTCDSSVSTCPDVSVSVDFNQFSANDGSTTTTIHGGLTLSQSDSSGTAGFSGTSLYLIAGSDAVQLTNFNISTTTVGVTTSTTADFTIAGTVIDGSITVNTTSPILQDVGELHPHGGTIVVTGAGGATLTIDYLDVNTVQLTLDPDGTGPTPANAPVTVLWSAM